ncbi:MAG: glycosyltransferase family 2 protein [Lachnospiraceae bacterium]|nr:glycosyltransferase family 2 protein [Lachnospiraceae bacterium]
MITISLCMIVKNEEAVLDRCLSSIAHLVEEIIIVDTGSTDRTKEIAARYTDQIYDLPWHQDFSEARNYAFSKASMEYIYTADADEVLPSLSQQKFRNLKEVMLPEVEIVQMKYVTEPEFNTVINLKREYRPKLYKRVRSFVWEDAVHETVRLTPIIFDSDIEVMHYPTADHSERDFNLLLLTFDRNKTLSKKLISMYARELFMAGRERDFLNAEQVFLSLYEKESDPELMEQECAVLIRVARLKKDWERFISLALADQGDTFISDICYEIGEYFFQREEYGNAARWFHKAVTDAEPMLNVRLGGDMAYFRLADCCEYLASMEQDESLRERAAEYRRAGEDWRMPEGDI